MQGLYAGVPNTGADAEDLLKLRIEVQPGPRIHVPLPGQEVTVHLNKGPTVGTWGVPRTSQSRAEK